MNTPAVVPPPEQPDDISAHVPVQEPEPVRGVFGAVDALLREPTRVMHHLTTSTSAQLTATLLFIALAAFLLYGVVAGSFSGGTQLWAAPVKIAGGLLFAALICFPSLFIFGCLAGVYAGMREMAGIVAGLLAIMAVLLIGFAPIAWVFSQSTESVAAMGALHVTFGLVAFFFGTRFVSASFDRFRAESHAGKRVWMIIFLLVVLQMTTALRPILDTAPTLLPTEKKFFIAHWTDCINAPTKAETGDKK
ncbi:MAG: hypothetical protein WCT04_18765 [Planctomycetota bacterium]